LADGHFKRWNLPPVLRQQRSAPLLDQSEDPRLDLLQRPSR